MTQIVEQLLGKLTILPDALQNRLAARWLKELEQGDGAIDEPVLAETSSVTFNDIKHLLGRFEGVSDDLSHNPKHMEGFGQKSMGRSE